MRWRGKRRRQSVGDALHVGDPRFDSWQVLRDFEDLTTASAWCAHLAQAGFEAVLTSDWPLDRFGRGDIAVRVPGEHWSDADDFLTELED